MISKEKKGKKEEKEKEGIEQKIIDLLSSGDGIQIGRASCRERV